MSSGQKAWAEEQEYEAYRQRIGNFKERISKASGIDELFKIINDLRNSVDYLKLASMPMTKAQHAHADRVHNLLRELP